MMSRWPRSTDTWPKFSVSAKKPSKRAKVSYTLCTLTIFLNHKNHNGAIDLAKGLTYFKIRVLDLLDIYANHESHQFLATELVQPLLTLIITNSSLTNPQM